MRVLPVLLVGVALAGPSSAPASVPASGSAAGGGEQPQGRPAPALPASEAALCATLDEFARRDRAAGLNEVKLADLREERGRALVRSIPGGRFTGWLVTVEDVHEAFMGKMVLRVKLPCRGALQTWGNAFSDVFDHTQIPKSSALFATLSRLKKESPVSITGTFLPSRDDGFREASATEPVSMDRPTFIVHFTSVAARDAGGHRAVARPTRDVSAAGSTKDRP